MRRKHMRKTLFNLQKDKGFYLVHNDMFPYTGDKIIDCSIQEENSVNVASGIAYTKHPVVVYGVCGFVLYKALEQIIYSAKEFGSRYAPIIFCNAGANGCYSKYGKGHEVKYDQQICDMLDIPLYEPKDANAFQILLQELLQKNEKNEKNEKNGIYFIRLGKDEC